MSQPSICPKRVAADPPLYVDGVLETIQFAHPIHPAPGGVGGEVIQGEWRVRQIHSLMCCQDQRLFAGGSIGGVGTIRAIQARESSQSSK